MKVVRAWNDALDRHDLTALDALYGPSVRFYGQARAKAAVLAAKRSAFAKQPAFRQELIGDVSLERTSDGSVQATFTKKAGPPDHFLVIGARLALTPSGGGFVVTEESDEESARRSANAPSDCESKASEVANALPEVKRALAEAQRDAEQSDGGAQFGGMGPNDDGDGGFTAAMGLHTDERFEMRFLYSVDRSGRLTVLAGGSELVVPAAGLRAVAAACKNR